MNKTVLFIVPYPLGIVPSQRFRFEQYIDFLNENNVNCVVKPFYSLKAYNKLYNEKAGIKKFVILSILYVRRFGLLFKVRKFNDIFIHRESLPVGPPIIEWFIKKFFRKDYIFDFDDAIWLPNYSKSNEKIHKLKAYWKTKYIIKWSRQTTVGNEFLAAYAKNYNENIEIIPTTIDTKNHHNITTDQRVSKITIGWTGSHTTLHYLDKIVPVISELEKEFEFDFKVICNVNPKYKLKSFVFVPWQKDTEIQDLGSFQIGLMPLKDNVWAKGKCGFKALQYMSLGIIPVVSPVGVNNSVVEDGETGFFASNFDDWESAIIKLLNDEDFRVDAQSRVKKIIEDKYSVEANKLNYLSLFNKRL